MIEDFLAPSQMTADGVALKFSESVQKLARTERDPQMAAMNEVSDMLPDTVLLDYIRAQIPSNDKLWTFRKHLAVQYACLVLVQHALFCAPPTPSKLVLSKLQGDVAIIGAVPGLNKDNSKMSDDFAETGAVPFRMTRMMTILLSSVGTCKRKSLPGLRGDARRHHAAPRGVGLRLQGTRMHACARVEACRWRFLPRVLVAGLQGGFSAAVGAAAMALTHPQCMLKHHLYSLLREELLSYGFPQVCTAAC